MSRTFGEDLSKWLIIKCKFVGCWRVCPPVDLALTFGGNSFPTFEDARKRFTEGSEQ